MSENLGLLRFYFVLLALFTVGRWAMGFAGVEYDSGREVFSIVILTVLASLHYGAFMRAFKGFTVGRAVTLGVTMAVVSQVVILLSTVISYAAGLESYFNAPKALNLQEAVGMGQAVVIRIQGLVVNSILNAILASLGWLMGAVIPKQS